MSNTIEDLTKQRSIELAHAYSFNGESGPTQEPGGMKIVGQIKRIASYIRDTYWKTREYGVGKSGTFDLVNANFGRIKDWTMVSEWFSHLNSTYRVEAGGAYETFRRYNAALMGLFSKKAYQMEAA
jgi:hypothetical protein